MGASEHHETSCPRCGYDLAGVVATWSGSSPLEGRCSECGLGFFWGDVLNERLRSLPWLYEHARRPWDLRAWFATLWRALAPWSFWKRVQVHHRVRPWRLALWLAVGPLLAGGVLAALYYPLIEGVNTLWAIGEPASSSQQATSWALNRERWVARARTVPLAVLREALGIVEQRHSWQRQLAPWWPCVLPPVCFSVFASIAMLVCRSEWRGARVAPQHFVRIAVYLLAPTVFLVTVVFLIHGGRLVEVVRYGVEVGLAGNRSLGWSAGFTHWLFSVDYRPVGLVVLVWQAIALCWALRDGLRLDRWPAMALVGGATGGVAALLAWLLGVIFSA